MTDSILMTTGEVAKLFRVDPKTVARWGKQGRLSSVKTPGGHRRYYRAEIMKMFESLQEEGKNNDRRTHD